MNKARVIITMACTRNCSYCCNQQASGIDGAIYIKDISQIPHRSEIMITGGEPMEHFELTRSIVRQAYDLAFRRIYLYTAKWNPRIYEILPFLNGIQYTIHENWTADDIEGFYDMQDLAGYHPRLSCRLYIAHNVNVIVLHPNVWKRVEVKPWINNCPLPPGETLYILE